MSIKCAEAGSAYSDPSALTEEDEVVKIARGSFSLPKEEVISYLKVPTHHTKSETPTL